MEILIVGLTALLVVMLGIIAGILWKSGTRTDPAETIFGKIPARLEALELGYIGLKQEVADGIDRANKAWARTRAAESKARRDAELEEYEGEQDHQLVLVGDEEGSGDPRMPAMHQDMDDHSGSVPTWKAHAQEYARTIASGGGD